MCLQRFEHFLCGHDRLAELLCPRGVERGPFFPKYLCPSYEIQSIDQNFSCGRGQVYCATATDAALFDTVLAHSEDIRAQILQIDTASQQLQRQVADLCAQGFRHGLTISLVQRSVEYQRCTSRLAYLASAYDEADRHLKPVFQLLRSRADYEVHRCEHVSKGRHASTFPAFLWPLLMPPGLPPKLEHLRHWTLGPQPFPPPPPLLAGGPGPNAAGSAIAPVAASVVSSTPVSMTVHYVKPLLDETKMKSFTPASRKREILGKDDYELRRSSRTIQRVNYAESEASSVPQELSVDQFELELDSSPSPESPLQKYKAMPSKQTLAPLPSGTAAADQPKVPLMDKSLVGFSFSALDSNQRVLQFTSPQRKVKVRKAALIAEESLRVYQTEKAAPYRPIPFIPPIHPNHSFDETSRSQSYMSQQKSNDSVIDEIGSVDSPVVSDEIARPCTVQDITIPRMHPDRSRVIEYPHVNQSPAEPYDRRVDPSPLTARQRKSANRSLHKPANAPQRPQRDLMKSGRLSTEALARPSKIVRLRVPQDALSTMAAVHTRTHSRQQRRNALTRPTRRVSTVRANSIPASPSLLLFGGPGRERHGSRATPTDGNSRAMASRRDQGRSERGPHGEMASQMAAS